MFNSTKLIELGSCAFRQPRADSHCKYLHGYQLKAKFWFEADSLDANHWVVDFGGLKELKHKLQQQFDHTTCIAADDPELASFERLHEMGVCDLRIMPRGTGVERISEWCFEAADAFVRAATNNRCRCIQVEVFEHENNSAIYTSPMTQEPSNIKQMELGLNDEQPVQTVETAPEPEQKTSAAPLSTNNNKTTNTWVDPNAPKRNSWLF